MYDVDKNGIPELLISERYNIIDMYTLSGTSLVKIFEDCYFGDRSRLHILKHGFFITEGSSGANLDSFEVYQFSSDGCTPIKIISYYYDSEGPNDYMNGYTYLGDDYRTKLEEYLTDSVYDSLNWTVFAKINPKD